ncbi:MAG: hypothetical protein JXR83_20870, partial [Deltaproteobacteria bacterium]|nr:hypothetical protein [Deltaproteobacteria bacterium]
MDPSRIIGLLARACSLAWLATAAGGCFTAESARRELDEASFGYHLDVRWLRCPAAAQRVDDDLRSSFIERCSGVEGRLNIENVEILDVRVEPTHDEATVLVRYSFFVSPSVSLQQVTVKERWQRKGT